MLNLNTLRQQQIPVMTEYRAQIPFHILAKPIGLRVIWPAAIVITHRAKRP